MTTSNNPTIGIWVGQTLHFSCMVVLLIMTFTAWSLVGSPHPILFWIAVAIPIVHQVYVWIAWRLELKDGTTSKAIGFNGYVFLFFVLFGGRFISLFALGWVDRGSLDLSRTPLIILTLLLAVPGIYAMISVKKYFGMSRAAGADHFDPKYRTMPFVKKGIFRFTNNGMYLYAFLLFWAIAIGLNSKAALIVAAFSHAYIWVHYYVTEKPDIDYLYNSLGQQ